MKKVLFALVAVAALTISSCCNNKAKETTCDKANTECVAAGACCQAVCEMADSCQMDCATCEKADSCQKVCPKKDCQMDCATCEKADSCQKVCPKKECPKKADACPKKDCQKACQK